MNALTKAAAVAAMAVTMTSAAQSQVMVDMSKVTCDQLLKGSANSIETAIWLSGYFNGLRKNTMLDINQFQKNADAVVKACGSNRSSTVMQTIEKLAAAAKR